MLTSAVFTFSLLLFNNCGSAEPDDHFEEQYVAQDDVDELRRLTYGNKDSGYGVDWIVMPDGNGSSRIALLDMENALSRVFENDQKFMVETGPPNENVNFTLYTRVNPSDGEPISFENLASHKNFDATKPTKILIHGWRASRHSEPIIAIKEAYLKVSDANVIAVDWSGPASNIFYPTPAAYTKDVGEYVARFIDELVDKRNVRPKDIHIIGHSLGAHTAGIAGHHTNNRVSRITGLDPALPGFQSTESKEDRLDEGDAEFVDVIHTCSGALGLSRPSGHADFYPNGGTPFQPGCCCLAAFSCACSHGRSTKYFAESILSETAFEGIKCSTWKNFKNHTCENVIVPMGAFTPATSRGIFYLQTRSQSPFGLGDSGTVFKIDE